MVCAIALAAVGLAACGGSGDGSTGGGGGASTAATTAEGPVITLATAVPETGQVFKAPEMVEGMEAAMEAINAGGGVDGHTLELSACDTTYSANGETECARQMVEEEPDAIVAPFLVADSSGASWPIIEKAGIPAIGQQGGTVAELNSPYAFPLGSSFVGPFAGTAIAVDNAGARNVVIVTEDPNPAGKPIEELVTGVLKSRGVTNVTPVVGHTQSDPTFATAAAEAIDAGPEAVIINAGPNNGATIIRALRGSGYEGTIAVPSLLMPAEAIAALGDLADGIVVTSANAFATDDANPGIKKFKSEMGKYAPGVPLEDAALEGWSGMHLFAEAAAGATKFDAAGLKEAFEKVAKPIELGTSGPWSVVGKTGLIPGFSRIVNPAITIGVVEGGEIVPSEGGGFVNPFAPPGE